MSLWDKLHGFVASMRPSDDAVAAREDVVPAPACEPQVVVESAVARLARLGEADGPSVDEAIALLRQARGTTNEASAVSAALDAAEARPVAEDVLVACAELLAARGENASALRVLARVATVSGLVLAADLHASAGELSRAVGTIERALAKDLAAPGAIERHRRWRAALGGTSVRPRGAEQATMVTALPRGGPFRLLREVARGGAGAVYEAEDEVLGRRVAFKVYHDRVRGNGALEREVAATAELAGPGVVRLFDANPREGWIAFEWVPLGSVRDVLRSGDISPLEPLETWVRPLARALGRIHGRGWVHADVKPANILLRARDEPVLGDFGLARRVGAPSDGGSAGYVSPERLAGRASDPRDDVFGFGRVLEDVIDRLGPAGRLAPWRALARACVGPDVDRPPDAEAVLSSLRALA